MKQMRINGVALVLLMCYMASGFLSAQPSQDYLNGQFSEQIHALTVRVENLEGILRYIATGVFGMLGVQLFNTVIQVQRDKRQKRRSDDEED